MNPSVTITGGEHYLWAAYIVVWVIHVAYILTLMNRGKQIERERKELNRN
jgi:CcmD family protein